MTRLPKARCAEEKKTTDSKVRLNATITGWLVIGIGTC